MVLKRLYLIQTNISSDENALQLEWRKDPSYMLPRDYMTLMFLTKLGDMLIEGTRLSQCKSSNRRIVGVIRKWWCCNQCFRKVRKGRPMSSKLTNCFSPKYYLGILSYRKHRCPAAIRFALRPNSSLQSSKLCVQSFSLVLCGFDTTGVMKTVVPHPLAA
jgi:hypothetical protein